MAVDGIAQRYHLSPFEVMEMDASVIRLITLADLGREATSGGE